MPRLMQRSSGLKSLGLSNGPPRKLLRCRWPVLAFASGVSAGILPSGGSITSHGWLRLDKSRFSSHHASGPRGPGGRFAIIFASASLRICSNSAGVMSASVLSPNSAGFSSGVAYSLSFANVPCRSGSPHGVRGAVKRCALAGSDATNNQHQAGTQNDRTALRAVSLGHAEFAHRRAPSRVDFANTMLPPRPSVKSGRFGNGLGARLHSASTPSPGLAEVRA